MSLCAIGKVQSSKSKYIAKIMYDQRKMEVTQSQTKKGLFLMPLILDVIGYLGAYKWFSTMSLDLQLGFWQIKMCSKDVKKIAIITKQRIYKWLVIHFGLMNATTTFQKIMNQVLVDEFLLLVKDLYMISTYTMEDHLKNVDTILKKLEGVIVIVNLEKSYFGKKKGFDLKAHCIQGRFKARSWQS